MELNITQEVAALERMTVRALQQKYRELFGEAPRSHCRGWLIRRIAWRLQANQEGALSDRARHRALEIANDADLRMTAPRPAAPVRSPSPPAPTRPSAGGDSSLLPAPGTRLTRRYKGRLVEVTVTKEGFEYEGARYKSLTAIAQAVTGAHWNGYHFFGLQKNREQR